MSRPDRESAGRGEIEKGTAKFLSGKAILVVEDEYLLALQLEDLLVSLGGAVRGPFSKIETARAAAQEGDFDLAILDINLNGTMVYPLADDLIARGVPFFFLSGYGNANLPERFRSVTRLNKPCDPKHLTATLQSKLPPS